GHVVAFAEALGMSRRKVGEWGDAWDRIVGEAGAGAPALPRKRTDRHLGTGSAPAATVRPASRGRAGRRSRHPDDSGFINFYVMATTEETDIVPVYHTYSQFPQSRLPRFLRGPLPPLPPAGRTGSGLPIRAPRRYTPPAPALRGFLAS
ncbi:hypothetical protein ACIA8H_35780, partial [Streptomyces goshikiensis]